MFRRYTAFLLVTLGPITNVPVLADGKVYWTDVGDFSIKRASLNGSNIETLLTAVAHPRYTALDPSHGRMYWTQLIAPGQTEVRRANLDGSGVESLVVVGNHSGAVALDVPAGKVYFNDISPPPFAPTHKIRRANLDGSNAEDVVTDLLVPAAIAVDSAGDKLYWTEGSYTDEPVKKIRRANLNGSSIEDLISSSVDLYGVALDLEAGKLYWTSIEGSIRRANLNGSANETLLVGLPISSSIAVDSLAGKLYWASDNAQKIYRANLDGTSVQEIVTGVGTPWGLALDLTCETTEPDCNLNGFGDSCDIASGFSEDCNANGVPDECESGLGPTVTSQPTSQAVVLGDAAILAIGASGSAPLSFRWRKSGTNLVDSGFLSGSLSPSLIIENIQSNDFDSYDCVVTDACGAAVSNSATLTLATTLPCDVFEWRIGTLPQGTGDTQAMVTWDPDGPGPQSRLLVLNRYAWDGTTWMPLGSGSFNTRALGVFEGSLVSGYWPGGPNHQVERWDGAIWQPLGTGMNGQVNAFVGHQGALIAGGWFSTADNVSVNYIARWNGTAWESLEGGITGGSPFTAISDLVIYKGDLIATGMFTSAGGSAANNIARWDGTEWHPLGTGINGQGWALTVYNDDLVVGGTFTTAGGIAVDKVARWNDTTWSPVGSGLILVGDLTVFRDQLVVSTGFIEQVKYWSGSSWLPLGDPEFNHVDDIFDMIPYRGQLVAGGDNHGWERWTPAGPPTILTQPISQTTDCCAAVTFSVVAQSTPPLSFQWRLNGQNLVDGTNIIGALTPNLTIQSVGPEHGGSYDVQVASECGLSISAAALLTVNPCIIDDCNSNGLPDVCDIANGTSGDCNGNGIPDECDIATGEPDCNGNGILDVCENISPTTITDQPDDQAICIGAAATFTVTATGAGTLTYQWRKDGQAIPNATAAALVIDNVGTADSGDYDVVVTGPCGTATSETATLTVLANMPASHYALTVLCPAATISGPNLLSFTDDGPAPGIRCAAERSFRLFAGRAGVATGKVWRVQQNCTAQLFGPILCEPESVLVDHFGVWPGVCGLTNLLIVGGCDTIYFINPANGAICEQFPDPSVMHIGQMAIDSIGRLFVGSVEGDALNVVSEGVVEPFYGAPGLSPRAVAIDDQDNVYLTCAVDGVMRKIAPDGTPIDETFATGLHGAVSQAIAPPGLFHGSIFIACGDRVMEVDRTTGVASVFFSCRQAVGVGFDPEGYLYVTEPTLNRILKIGPGLPGDMDGNGAVNLQDTTGFVLALLQDPAAPLPIRTADLNGDGCADGLDISPFVVQLVGP